MAQHFRVDDLGPLGLVLPKPCQTLEHELQVRRSKGLYRLINQNLKHTHTVDIIQHCLQGFRFISKVLGIQAYHVYWHWHALLLILVTEHTRKVFHWVSMFLWVPSVKAAHCITFSCCPNFSVMKDMRLSQKETKSWSWAPSSCRPLREESAEPHPGLPQAWDHPNMRPLMHICDFYLWPISTYVQILGKGTSQVPTITHKTSLNKCRSGHISVFYLYWVGARGYQSWENSNSCSFTYTCTMSQWAVSSWNLSWTWALRDHLDHRFGNLFWTPGRCTAQTTYCTLAIK